MQQQSEFWRTRAPALHCTALHIEERGVFEDLVQLPFPGSEKAEFAALIKEEGYVQSSADWGVDLPLMAKTVRALSADGLSPVFAFLYDEFWCPFVKLHQIYNALLGGRYLWLPAFWVWDVDPKRGEAGWKPHRDRGAKSAIR